LVNHVYLPSLVSNSSVKKTKNLEVHNPNVFSRCAPLNCGGKSSVSESCIVVSRCWFIPFVAAPQRHENMDARFKVVKLNLSSIARLCRLATRSFDVVKRHSRILPV